MSIFTLISALQGFDYVEAGEQAIRNHLPEAAQLNVEQQREGKDAFGSYLPRYRSRKMAEAKHSRNPKPPFGVWDLWLTGSYQSQFKASVVSGSLWIRSDDSKYDKIMEKAPQAMGLNDESKVEYNNQYLVDDITIQFKRATGL